MLLLRTSFQYATASHTWCSQRVRFQISLSAVLKPQEFQSNASCVLDLCPRNRGSSVSFLILDSAHPEMSSFRRLWRFFLDVSRSPQCAGVGAERVPPVPFLSSQPTPTSLFCTVRGRHMALFVPGLPRGLHRFPVRALSRTRHVPMFLRRSHLALVKESRARFCLLSLCPPCTRL